MNQNREAFKTYRSAYIKHSIRTKSIWDIKHFSELHNIHTTAVCRKPREVMDES